LFNNIDKIIDLQQKFLNLTLKARLLKRNQIYNTSSTKALETQNDIKTDITYEEELEMEKRE
jgi:hypothetical protein